MKDSVNLITLLNDLAVIEITGADAASFLQSQLTHDVSGLDSFTARLAGYCTAKGRLLGTLVLWRRDPAGNPPVFRALAKADIAEALVKRLSMYVLRAKVGLRVTDLNVMGIAGAALPASELEALPVRPPAWTTAHLATGTYIAAPSGDHAVDRWWFIPEAPDSVAAPPHDPAVDAQWNVADIAAGLPWIVVATQDLFIPQTLNLDLIDGISFTKGCYPGQEVVARSHYRGTIKRRMAYGIADVRATDPIVGLAGSDIYDAAGTGAPCGRVINSAQAGLKIHLLLEVQLSDLDTARFRLGRPEGPAIDLRELPYSIRQAS